jgi:hypothetical protein
MCGWPSGAITLAPENGELVINLCGDLAAMLSYAANGKPTSFAAGGSGFGSQESLIDFIRRLVAGTRKQRESYRLPAISV